jgi:glycosyltransferase involved in cell wall biosynthesis
MPNVVLEAQAAGLPVVATNVGGVPDCTVHGQTSFIAEATDSDRLFDYAFKVLTNRSQAIQMGRNGCALMHDQYSKKAMTERFVSLVNGESQDHSSRRDAAAQYV